MISPEFKEDHQALRYAVIECLLDINGEFTSNDIADAFGTHRCNAAKIVKKYILDVNFDIMYYPSAKRYRPMPEYERKVLSPETNPVRYMNMLYELHGKKFNVEMDYTVNEIPDTVDSDGVFID